MPEPVRRDFTFLLYWKRDIREGRAKCAGGGAPVKAIGQRGVDYKREHHLGCRTVGSM
jgi:hypothetical protein